MWNSINTLGHRGHFMGPQTNQRREFCYHVHNMPPVPSEAFMNPNFINKYHHSYQNNFISTPIQKISHIDSSNVNNNKSLEGNGSLVNSSQSIINTIKENQLDIIKTVNPNSVVVETPVDTTKTELTKMCYSRKRNRRSKRNRRKKNSGKNSRQNTNIQQIRDMMDVDIGTSPIKTFDKNMSPKISNSTCIMTDFIEQEPNEVSNSIIEDESEYDSDEGDLIAIVSVSPPNNSRTSLRERQLSLAESEDSFIVFDRGTDEELESSDESEKESEDDSENEEYVDSSSSIESSATPSKRVRFAEDTDLCEVHLMVQWSFAYQQARKGRWEEYVRDRDRFNRRIADTSKILSPIFDAKHRETVYQERFNEK